MQNQVQETLAIRLFVEQLTKLQYVRQFDSKNAQFVGWRDTTTSLFQRFLPPDSPHFVTFRELKFRAQMAVRRLPFSHRGLVRRTSISPQDRERFESDCAIAEGCIKAALDEIREFGVSMGKAELTRPNGGVMHQNFNATVTIQNQAIAAGGAIQHVSQHNQSEESLRALLALLQESEELKKRELNEAQLAFETVSKEMQKPEPSRNWRNTLDGAKKVLEIANLATDVGTKLVPYLPAIYSLVEHAKSSIS
jgi:hypothetical protein